MARTPRKPASGKTQASAPGGRSERERIVEAFMGLLAEQPRLTPGCHGGGDGCRLSGLQS